MRAPALAETLNRHLVRPLVDPDRGRKDRYPRLTLPASRPHRARRLRLRLRLRRKRSRFARSAAPRRRCPHPPRTPRIRGGRRDPRPAIAPTGFAASPGPEHGAPARNREDASDADPLDGIEARFLDDRERLPEPIVAPIRAAVGKAASLEAVRDALPGVLERADDRPFARRLAAAAFTARGIGDAGA